MSRDLALPDSKWILHASLFIGGVTDRWIGTQVQTHSEYDARLLGVPVTGAASDPHWLELNSKHVTRLALRGMFLTDGLSPLVVARQLQHAPPIAVHAHYGTIASGYVRLAHHLGVPLVASFYGHDATSRRITASRRWRTKYQALFGAAAAVLVEGPAMARRVEHLGCPPDKLHVVRLPADADALETVEHRPPERFTVVAAGRFEEKKGFDTAIAAFARAFRGRDASLVMVGGGPSEKSLRTLASSEGVADQVQWRGRLPFEEFMRAIANCSVAVFPSRAAGDGDSDGGAPVTLIETQWIGVPCLISDHDDLPFVTPPDTAALPKLDVSAWADALASAAEDSASMEATATAAQDFVREHHSPLANAVTREAIYNASSASS